MKNNTDLFIKYLDGELSIQEKVSLENELKLNSELNSEFTKFSESYNSLKRNIDVDERYFDSLIPKSRKRMEKNTTSYIVKFVYILPLILVGMFLLNELVLEKGVDSKYNFEKLLDSFTEDEETTIELISDVYNINNNYRIDEQLLSSLYDSENAYDQTLYDYLSENVETSQIENQLFNQLSDDEFDLVYNKLMNKNF